MQHITSATQQNFEDSRPRWVQVGYRRGIRKWRHRCPVAGMLVLTDEHMGIYDPLLHRHHLPGEEIGCPRCADLPPIYAGNGETTP